MDVRPAPPDPVAERPMRRLERDPAPGDGLGPERLDLERLWVQPIFAPDDAGLERDHDDRRLEPRVQPDDLAGLDDQAGLLEGLADRRFGHGLVDLEEAARLGPPALAG